MKNSARFNDCDVAVVATRNGWQLFEVVDAWGNVTLAAARLGQDWREAGPVDEEVLREIPTWSTKQRGPFGA